MKNIFKYPIILILLLGNSVLSQDSLNQYLTVAAENNPGLKASYFEYQAALEKVPQVGTLPDPQVSFGYFIQPVETRLGPQQARISVIQKFPWFGTLGAQKNVAAQQAKAKFEQVEETKYRLFYEVRAHYFKLYFIKRNITVIDENLTLLQSIKMLVQSEIITGKASVADEILLEIEFGDLQNERQKFLDLYQAEQAKFKNLLNVNRNYLVVLPDSLENRNLSLSPEEIVEKIRSENPQLLQYDYLHESFVEKENLAGKSGLPQFSLGLDYIFVGKRDDGALLGEENGRDAFLFPMLSFSLPIYRGKYSGQSHEARYMQQSNQQRKLESLNKFESFLEESLWRYRDADRRIDLYRKQQALARKALRIMKADYQKQHKSLEDLLRMETKVINYTLAVEKALVDKRTEIAFINYLMGQ